MFREAYAIVEAAYPQGLAKLKFNEALKRVLDLLVTDLIEATRRRVAESGAASVDDIRHAPQRLAGFSAELAARNAELKSFLSTHLYQHPAITDDRNRSVPCLGELFAYYLRIPSAMPPFYAELAEKEPRHVVVCDYIAGMTDQYLLRRHRELFGAGRRTVN